jgi:hypothetical protein
VNSSAELRRPLVASISVVAAVVLIVGLLHATGDPTEGGSPGLAVGAPAAAALTQPRSTAVATRPVTTVSARVQAVVRRRATATTANQSAPEAVAQESAAQPEPAAAVDTIGPLTRPVVVLYGDSLAWESRQSFVESFADRPDVEVHTRTFGGTAICDWLDEMAADAASIAPGIVVVEFSGNSFTPCMYDASGVPVTGPAVTERYAGDAATVISTFAPVGTHVVFAGAPVSGPTSAAVGRMNDLYRDIANGHDGVWYADAGAAVLVDDSYTITLPCLSSEPCQGGYNSDGLPVNVVRAPDGVHFCPVSGDAVQGVTDDCPVWSSGAYRYGRALAQPVIDALAVSPPVS